MNPRGRGQVHDHPDDDLPQTRQQFGRRSKFNQKMKTTRTLARRLEKSIDVESLARGRVVQVYSRVYEVEVEGALRKCSVKKTLQQAGHSVVVGDFVRVSGPAESGVIEFIEDRRTILTRSDSFKAIENHPIVANAEQMLIVAAIVMPRVKWGLIDRMIVAARAGGLAPIVCINKVDLLDVTDVETGEKGGSILEEATARLDHYRTVLGVRTHLTSVSSMHGIDALRDDLVDRQTVLAGHSGVGKSSLIRAVDARLDLRVGEVSSLTQKGKHTTTSARIYPLHVAGQQRGEVIDTPGVKVFGLWSVTRDDLIDHFPDVSAENAPDWRRESYQRIYESLPR